VAYTQALIKVGILKGGERFKSIRSARRVRVREGKSVVLDGPYCEKREQLGGFFIIDVPSEGEALSWAERCPATREGTIEVRPSSPAARYENLSSRSRNPGIRPVIGASGHEVPGTTRRQSMRYMMLIHHDEAALAAAPQKELWAEYGAFNEALSKAGAGMASGERLQPSSAATTVRVGGGKTDVLDGPYADTKEQFAGYFFVTVQNLDEAIAWAKRCPSSKYGSIEIRPIVEQTASWK